MKIHELINEAVAGPKNCWPGHRKVGTQPGTGKNKGKRVNDCEKIGEQGVAEGDDFFAGSKFADEEGNTFSVEKIIAFAKKNPKYFHKDFPLSKIKHDLSWWQGNKERMMNADTSFPLLVIQNDDGHLGVADGLNRMKKAVDVEKKQTIDVYLVPKKDIMKFSEKQGVAEGSEHYDGIEISMEKEDDEIMVKAMMSGGRELGHVLFVIDGEYLAPQDLEVDERYQGQGIAATMYDYVKSKGYKIRRSGQQTDAGAGFWDKHKPGKNVWEQGVAEGLDDPWGDQGNFAGDKPVNIGGDTVKQLQVGDIVTYFGQKARIEAMSKTGNTSRITIANKMGGTTQDVLTRDLKRTGISEENGGVGGGFGTNYPGTYEQENGPFTHKGGLKLTSLTTESVDYLDEK